MSYKLYKVTNLVNQKIYIGITKNSIEDRWKKHLSDSLMPMYPLHCAIQKYGKENFIIELLEESEDRQYIANKEDPTIEFYESRINQHGYNVAKGGYGGNLGESANLKRRQTIASRSPERKLEISKKLSISHTGKIKTEETKAKMSASQLAVGGYGPSVQTEETRNKISISNSGKIRSAEARENYSKAASLRGTGPQLMGKKISCLCCNKDWDLGNYSQHIKRKEYELQ